MSAILTFLLGLITSFLTALGLIQVPASGWNGYVEADYVYLSALTPGRITTLAVTEGATVAQGAVLITLETDAQQASLAAAKAGVAQAAANLDNLSTGGRAAEIAVISASVKRALADRDQAAATLARSQSLAQKGEVTSAKLQQDQNTYAGTEALLEQLQAQLQVAGLPARDAQRLAAEAGLDVAKSQERSAQIALDDRSLTAPIAGRVDQIFYEKGEVAGSGAPILSLFDPAALKVIFFVPETKRAGLHVDDTLAVTCDGCPATLMAHVTRIGSQPQFTPPILYSRDERGRLVFRAEATLDASLGLSPGQPVSLTPMP